MAVDEASVDEVIDDGGDVALAFFFVNMLRKEGGEVSIELGEEGEGKGPKVHGDDDVFFDLAGLSIERSAFDEIDILAGDVDDFFNTFEEAFLALADAAIDGAVIGKGVYDLVSYEGVVSFVAGGRIASEEACGLLVGIGSVKIVGIDDGEGAVDLIAGGEDGMRCSPRFFAALGDGESLGEVIEFLERIGDFDLAGELGADRGLESLGKVLSDDEDDFRKPSANGVEDGVIENGFTVGAHWVHLFEAAITAAHSGCENDECGRICHVGRDLGGKR